MAYKNSGAMKFNDATDLVIRADPDGTVESVFNRADSTEYISEYSVIENVNCIITNNTSSAKSIYRARESDGLIEGGVGSVNAGVTVSSFTSLKNGVLVKSAAASHWTVVSGNAEIINATKIQIKGNCELTIEDD